MSGQGLATAPRSFSRLWGGAALGILLLLAEVAPVRAASCPPAEDPAKLTLNSTFGPVQYDFSRSRDGIAQLLRRTGLSALGGQAVGLTNTEFQFRYSIGFRVQQVDRNRYCGTLTNLDLEIGYGTVTVYVNSAYPPGSCARRVTLDHEKEHVALYREGFERFVPELKRHAEAFTASARPVLFATQGSIKAHFEQQFNAHLRPLIERFNQRQERANLAIDTRDNYRRTQALCETW